MDFFQLLSCMVLAFALNAGDILGQENQALTSGVAEIIDGQAVDEPDVDEPDVDVETVDDQLIDNAHDDNAHDDIAHDDIVHDDREAPPIEYASVEEPAPGSDDDDSRHGSDEFQKGDFNRDGLINDADLDIMIQLFRNRSYVEEYDLNNDGKFDLADRDFWYALKNRDEDVASLVITNSPEKIPVTPEHWTPANLPESGIIVDSQVTSASIPESVEPNRRPPQQAAPPPEPEPLLLSLAGMALVFALVAYTAYSNSKKEKAK